MYLDARSPSVDRYKVDNGVIEIHRENQQRGEFFGDVIGICLHWNAGWYHQAYDGYHLNVALTSKDSKNPVVVQTLGLGEKGQHLYARNTGMVGISICCMAKPDVVPSIGQLDTTSILVAEISAWKRLDFKELILPKKQDINGKLVDIPNKTIKVLSVTDHAEFARYDYPSFRVDIGKYKKQVIDKARVYYNELKTGKRKFTYESIFK